MTKHFCDECGQEMTSRNTPSGGFEKDSRLGVERGSFFLEIVTSKDGQEGHGDFCKYCIIDLVKAADDRDRLVK